MKQKRTMKFTELLCETSKEIPNDAKEKGYINLLRGGYIKQITSGIFSLMPLAKKVENKIIKIIKDEMDGINGQEVLFPVVMPKELWDESGRYSSIGDEMVRFLDRTGHNMLLGMTHEEASVQMARNTIKSYKDLPLMIYQVQTKFRDEARSRGGLIRVREFTMQDGYSFHENQESLNETYEVVKESYHRIYKKCGLKNVISVSSDTGMMGGAGADEFMYLNPMGEDSIIICPHCGYNANMEVAKSKREEFLEEERQLEKVYTGEAKTIEEICSLLNVPAHKTCKAVCYADREDYEKKYLIFLRGDLEVNEAKLRACVKREVVPAILEEGEQLVAGNIGVLGLEENENLKIIYDNSLLTSSNLVTGANEEEYHILNFNAKRDLKDAKFEDVGKVKEGECCPNCQEKLTISRGVEVGNIFKLGVKYSDSMNMRVLNRDGKPFAPIMGCYGIGVGRLLACIAEDCSDEKGLVWPKQVAPFEVYVCPIKYEDENVQEITNRIDERLRENGVSVLLDDRNLSAGRKFTDSELLGIPFRVTISKRAIEEGLFEVHERETGNVLKMKEDEVIEYLTKIFTEIHKEYDL